ncbi:MAG: nucleotidyltransferase family protein [Dehalococcoidia bacterium]
MPTVKQSAPRRADVVQILADHRQDLIERGVRSLAIFGSVARDEAGPDSDVDVLVEFNRPTGLFALFDLNAYLEGLLERPVDLTTSGGLKERVKPSVIRDLVHVY